MNFLPPAPAADGGPEQRQLPMYVHSKSTSAVLNDLGIYVLTKIHKWQHLSCFKNIPKFNTTEADAWRTDYWPEIRGADDQVVFPTRPLITGLFLAYLASLFPAACHYRVGDSRLGGIAEMCYDRLAKRFGAYDAATLQPFLSRRLIAWYAMFPVSGPAAGGSDSDGEGGGGGYGGMGGGPGSDSDQAPPIPSD